ncbi:MAG: ABC transporter ATP-binding protein [Salinirussus sp.]
MSLEISHLSRAYADFEFGPVDLEVGREVLSVLGPSGSGKTTLLSLVAGVVRAETGSILLDGRELVDLPPEDRRTGLVFQDGALFPHLSARENVSYAATGPDRVAELANLLEIEDVLDRRPAALSGGERQRVALARTLAADPDALLLDEPLSSLDAPIRRRLRDQLHDLFRSLEIPVVHVTHDQAAAAALGDRIAVLRDGGIEQVGSARDVLDRPETAFVARFTGTDNILDGEVTGETDGRLEVAIDGATIAVHGNAGIGEMVTLAVHPARLSLLGPHEETDCPVVAGTVRDWVDEATGYRVVVDTDGVTLTVAIPPQIFDRLDIERGAAVHVSVPSSAVHLLE